MITMTYNLAMAAGQDAANAQMRKAGRTTWSIDDYNKAVEVFERLWTVEDQLAARAEGEAK